MTSAECVETNTSTQTGSSNKTVSSTEAFTASGTFTNQRYDAYQACHSVTSDFDIAGTGASDFEQDDMSNEMGDCDCKALKGRKAEHFDEEPLGFEESCLHTETIGNPDEDLDRRIADQVEKTISDILSDVFDRCISTSLKGCIQM